jgi:hypothetical protein
MRSRCFGIMEGHGNFLLKLSIELGYIFTNLRL